jgi:ATP-dependent DNA helicase RecG
MPSDQTDSLDQASVRSLAGVGPALSAKLERLGVRTLADVLFHLPLRYEDRTRITPIARVRLGDHVVLEGRVVSCTVAFGKRRSLLAQLEDASGRIALRFFHFSRGQQQNLEQAGLIRCYGEIRRGAAGLEMYHPEYTRPGLDPLPTHLTPIYPATEGVTQSRYRSLVEQVLALMAAGKVLAELLPPSTWRRYALAEAIRIVHRPPLDADIDRLGDGTHPAQQRLSFEELLAHHTSLRVARERVMTFHAYPVRAPGTHYRQLNDAFGFQLTRAQQRVAMEISQDMAKPVPMLRLLQGDVGSGKTVVAALAAILAVENQLQVAIMAPTEILAEQHYLAFAEWFASLGINTAFLSGRVKGKRRATQLQLIADGTAGIVVGTHALFQEDVTFDRLGLVIIDEQHRFGVHQRLALREKGEGDGYMPHQLVMTATPIPRTLTMSVYADMDTSVIDELPPGRTPVTTSVMPDSRRDEVMERVRSACVGGSQAYWVCTLIDDSEAMQCQAAEATARELALCLPEQHIGLIHGRLSPKDKSAVMDRFKTGHISLLVATTVIEVGVDVANASLMIIENPERLGLAQLHQLRGRIGRGVRQSFCVLLYHPPLSEISRRRLNVLRETTDGFIIAEQDLKIRGPGELLGSRQSGSVAFRIADLVRDNQMLPEVRTTASQLLATDRDKAQAIMNRWLFHAAAVSNV